MRSLITSNADADAHAYKRTALFTHICEHCVDIVKAGLAMILVHMILKRHRCFHRETTADSSTKTK